MFRKHSGPLRSFNQTHLGFVHFEPLIDTILKRFHFKLLKIKKKYKLQKSFKHENTVYNIAPNHSMIVILLPQTNIFKSQYPWFQSHSSLMSQQNFHPKHPPWTKTLVIKSYRKSGPDTHAFHFRHFDVKSQVALYRCQLGMVILTKV